MQFTELAPERRVAVSNLPTVEPSSGNVRELINVVERAILLAERHEVAIDALPATIVPRRVALGAPASALAALCGPGWRQKKWRDVRNASIDACERIYFVELLTRTRGNLRQTASAAGMNPKSLYGVMKGHRLEKSKFRKPDRQSEPSERGDTELEPGAIRGPAPQRHGGGVGVTNEKNDGSPGPLPA